MCQFMCKASCSKIIESLYFKRETSNLQVFSILASGKSLSCRPGLGGFAWALAVAP